MMAARHKRGWPEGSQYAGKQGMEMKGGGKDWWHFLDVPKKEMEEELRKWRRENPGYEFRVKETPLDNGREWE